MIGIYKITNLINGKVYIGQSIYIERRWRRHRNAIQYEETQDYPLYRAMRKYGIENFSFEIIQECEQEELNDLECQYIEQYNSLSPNGYNQTVGGQNTISTILTREQAIEIQKLLKSTNLSQEEIGKQFNISQKNVSDINIGAIWLSKDLSYPIRKISILKKHNYCIDCEKEIMLGTSRCMECYHKSLRRVERPDRETLKQLIRTLPFTQIGKNFGVTDNTIRKWCKAQNLPTKKTEITKISDTDWDKI